MNYLVISGFLLVIVGLLAILFVVISALKIKKLLKENLIKKNVVNQRLQKLLPINLAGLFISLIGIMIIALVFILR